MKKKERVHLLNSRGACQRLLLACGVLILSVSCSVAPRSGTCFCEVTDVRKDETHATITGERAQDLKKALDRAYRESPAWVRRERRECRLFDTQGRFRSVSPENLILSIAFTEGAESRRYEISRAFDNQFVLYGPEGQHPYLISEEWVETLRAFIGKNQEAP